MAFGGLNLSLYWSERPLTRPTLTTMHPRNVCTVETTKQAEALGFLFSLHVYLRAGGQARSPSSEAETSLLPTHNQGSAPALPFFSLPSPILTSQGSFPPSLTWNSTSLNATNQCVFGPVSTVESPQPPLTARAKGYCGKM